MLEYYLSTYILDVIHCLGIIKEIVLQSGHTKCISTFQKKPNSNEKGNNT